MKKYIIHIIFVVIMISICIYTFLVCSSKSYYDKNYSEKFIKSVNYIKDGNYVKSYEVIKNSSDEEKEIIQTIYLYEFLKETDKYLKISSEITDEINNIMDYILYPNLYDKNSVYQKNIDKIYADEYNKLFEIKNKLPKEIMLEEVYDLYDTYIQLIEIDKDTFKNYEYNVFNKKTILSNSIENVKNKLYELLELIKDVKGKYPSEFIPFEYAVLLEIE